MQFDFFFHHSSSPFTPRTANRTDSSALLASPPYGTSNFVLLQQYLQLQRPTPTPILYYEIWNIYKRFRERRRFFRLWRTVNGSVHNITLVKETVETVVLPKEKREKRARFIDLYLDSHFFRDVINFLNWILRQRQASDSYVILHLPSVLRCCHVASPSSGLHWSSGPPDVYILTTFRSRVQGPYSNR